MVRTYSSNEIRIKLKNFKLLDVCSGKKKSFKDFFSDIATVIMFICNHCPYVKHIHTELVSLAKDYLDKGISFLAINSNDVDKYPEDSPVNMKKISDQLGFTFPYFFDDEQKAAKYFGAKCTPEFFIFHKKDYLIYHGQLDDSRPENGIKVTGYDVRQIIEKLLNGIKIDPIIKPSYGCNIKWKT
ncbi:thioredoxin family protein [Blattabacterium cuenoti]|uniref:thioredoxin family protein n=1 Tax=Blattabacterium cuenoti TaxID=1653831 RepID=UPI00163C290D|nr:thioredoxin family protein [Blattabacterium cuenoti]